MPVAGTAVAAGLGLFALGAIVGVAGSRIASPADRYLYTRVGSDLQRVDKATGRIEGAGDGGWWNGQDRYAPVEAEVRRFGMRMGEIEASARRGEVTGVKVEGRQITVYPQGHPLYTAYADGMDDPRLGILVARLRDSRPPNMVDLLDFATGASFDSVWERRVAGTFEGLPVFFPSLDDLIAMKRATGRPQDLADLDRLERTKRLL